MQPSGPSPHLPFRDAPRRGFDRSRARQLPPARAASAAGFRGRRMDLAGLEAYMAGKADLVNGIADGVEAWYLQSVPVQDGWKIPESYADGGLAFTQSSGSPPDDGSIRVGTGGGSSGDGPPPP